MPRNPTAFKPNITFMSINSDQLYNNNKSMTTEYILPPQINSNWLYLVSSYATPDTSYLHKGTSNGTTKISSYDSQKNAYFQPIRQGEINDFVGGYRGPLGLGHP
jgi:hypothetical protein